LGVLINFFVFGTIIFLVRISMCHQYFSNQYFVNQILSHASVDDNVACEISHFSRFRKRFYDQVFELLDGCSGGVVVDSFQLHNTVKHCGLSSRRSRVQIPAGALHNSRMISIDTHIISKVFTSIFNLFDNLTRRFRSLIISNLTSNG
jgi:hypothetical protein